MQKVGRNDPCPCGSGKKYKRCCLPAFDRGSLQRAVPLAVLPKEVQEALTLRTHMEAERIHKYGHVRPPISIDHSVRTFVDVGARLLHNPRWKTFPDFLFLYIGSVFEKDWFAAELSKPI